MTKFLMLCDVLGADGELIHAEGSTVDLDAKTAKSWMERRVAAPVKAPAKKKAAAKKDDD